MKTWAPFVCSFFLIALSGAQSYRPKSGYVPDSATAVKIAEAVLVPVYGEKQVVSERPFTATLKKNVWTIEGTFRCPDGAGCRGGAAIVQLSKLDGRIVSMTFGR